MQIVKPRTMRNVIIFNLLLSAMLFAFFQYSCGEMIGTDEFYADQVKIFVFSSVLER